MVSVRAAADYGSSVLLWGQFFTDSSKLWCVRLSSGKLGVVFTDWKSSRLYCNAIGQTETVSFFYFIHPSGFMCRSGRLQYRMNSIIENIKTFSTIPMKHEVLPLNTVFDKSNLR